MTNMKEEIAVLAHAVRFLLGRLGDASDEEYIDMDYEKIKQSISDLLTRMDKK